jgi:hypothetical protein
MTVDECFSLLNYFYADFQIPLEREKVLLWSETFRDVDYDEAKLAARNLVPTLKFPPSAGQFQEALDLLRSRKALAYTAPKLPAPENNLTKEERQAQVERLKPIINSIGKKVA